MQNGGQLGCNRRTDHGNSGVTSFIDRCYATLASPLTLAFTVGCGTFPSPPLNMEYHSNMEFGVACRRTTITTIAVVDHYPYW
jgi:hypothetical protein